LIADGVNPAVGLDTVAEGVLVEGGTTVMLLSAVILGPTADDPAGGRKLVVKSWGQALVNGRIYRTSCLLMKPSESHGAFTFHVMLHYWAFVGWSDGMSR
jgi:hypothetical protein